MQKKISSLVKMVSILLLIGVFLMGTFGCKPKSTVDDPGKSASTKSDSTTPDSTTSDPTPVRKVEDLGGYKFSILSLWGTGYARYNPEQGKTALDDAYYERLQKLQSDYNFTVEMKSQSLDTFISYIQGAAMAGEKPADFIILDYGHFQALRTAGVLESINKETMPNINLSDSKWFKAISEGTTFDGKIYGFNNEAEPGTVCIFNSTLLKEKNCADPYELYKAGKWNWEEFEKLAKFMTIDENGDNNPEIYGITTVDWGTFQFETPFIYANGGNILKYDNGKFRFALLDSDAQEALNFVRKLYNEKVLYPQTPTSNEGARDLFMSRKAAFMFHQFGMVGYIKEMDDNFGVLPFPKGPQAKDYVSMSAQLPMIVTTIANDDPYKSSLILDLLTEPLGQTGDPTVDDALYNLKNNILRDDTSVEVYLELRNKIVPCLMNGSPSFQSNVMSQINASTKDNDTTPKAAMESIQEQCQIAIDEFFKQ